MRTLLWLLAFLLISPLLLLLALFWAPPSALARLAESGASRLADVDLSLQRLDIAWFDAGPGVAFEQLSLPNSLIDAGYAEAVLNAGDLLSLDLLFDRVALRDTRIELQRDASGQWNWQSVFAKGDEQPQPDANSNASTGSFTIPAIRDIAVEDVQIVLQDAVLQRQADIQMAISGSSSDPARPTEWQAEGTVDQLPLSLDMTLNPLAELATTLDDLAITASAGIGETRLRLEGVIGNPSTLSDLNLVFEAQAPDLQDAEALARLALPVLPPWKISGAVVRDGNEWLLQRFDGRVGDSDLQGDVRVNPADTPPELYANLISETLDLDDLAGLFGGVPDPDESATAEQRENAESLAEIDRLLPDEPLALPALTEFFTGAIDYRAQAVRSPVWPIESVDVRLMVDEGETDVQRLRVDLAEGRISGTARLDANEQPSAGELTLEVSAVNLRTIMQTVGIDDDSFGRIGGNLRYWFSGDSIAEMAASLDGGLFLLMTEGQLDALLVELSGLDIVESLFLALDPGKTLTGIDCAYLDIQTEQGVADIAQLVIDSQDTVFIGDGVIDLNDESLDVAIEPYPKDASILSAQTSVRVRGTVGDLQVIPGSELPLRATAAAVLSTLAAPIAALLPLVQTGGAEESAWCDGLVESLDEASENEQ